MRVVEGVDCTGFPNVRRCTGGFWKSGARLKWKMANEMSELSTFPKTTTGTTGSFIHSTSENPITVAARRTFIVVGGK